MLILIFFFKGHNGARAPFMVSDHSFSTLSIGAQFSKEQNVQLPPRSLAIATNVVAADHSDMDELRFCCRMS